MKLTSALIVLGLLTLVNVAQAAVITTVEWESKPGAPWSYTAGPPYVDCAVPPSPSGGCALRFEYPAGTYSTSFGGGRAEYAISGQPTDLYIGAWMRYSDPFQFHPNGQKVNFFILGGGNGGCRNVAFGLGYLQYSATPQICWGGGSYNNFANKSAWDVPAHLSEWHWYEMRIKVNTPGGSDGIAEMWIDDVLHLQYFDLRLRDVGDTAGFGSMQHTAEYGGGGSVIDQDQFWWVDHTVISTTKIGMPGGAKEGGGGAPGSGGGPGTGGSGAPGGLGTGGSGGDTGGMVGAGGAQNNGGSTAGAEDGNAGGCGCSIASPQGNGMATLLGLIAVAGYRWRRRQSRRARTVRSTQWLLAASLAMACSWSAVASAETFWTEDWEGTGEEVASRWPETSCANPTTWPDNDPLATNSSPARASSPVYTGSKSLQYHFTGLQPVHGGCYSSRYFPETDEIWMRWYERWGAGMQTAGGPIGGCTSEDPSTDTAYQPRPCGWPTAHSKARPQ